MVALVLDRGSVGDLGVRDHDAWQGALAQGRSVRLVDPRQRAHPAGGLGLRGGREDPRLGAGARRGALDLGEDLEGRLPADVGEAAHRARDLGALARRREEAPQREAVLGVGIVERLDERARERGGAVLAVAVVVEGVRGHEQLEPAVAGEALLGGADDGGGAERIRLVRGVPALEHEGDGAAGTLAEDQGDVGEGVSRVGLRGVEVEEELAVVAEDDPARGIEEDGPLGAVFALEDLLDLLGEVHLGVEIDHAEPRVGERQARPDDVPVERPGRRPQVGQRRRRRDHGEPHQRPPPCIIARNLPGLRAPRAASAPLSPRATRGLTLGPQLAELSGAAGGERPPGRLTEPVVRLYVAAGPSGRPFRRQLNWKIALALCALGAALGPAAAGCAADACDQADNHVSDCALIPQTSAAPSGMSMTNNCSGVRFCQSQCINQASCADLNASECFNQISCNQIPGQPLSAFEQCMVACSAPDGGADGG